MLVKQHCAPHRDIVCDDRQAIDDDLLACAAVTENCEEEKSQTQGKYAPDLEKLPTLFKISLLHT